MIKATVGKNLDVWIRRLFPFLFWARLDPNALTVAGALVSTGAAALFAAGSPRQAGVVILANLSTVKPGALARKVADAYLGDRLAADDLLDAAAITLSEADLNAFTGLYRDERTHLTRLVKLEDGKLTVNGPFGDRMTLTRRF